MDFHSTSFFCEFEVLPRPLQVLLSSFQFSPGKLSIYLYPNFAFRLFGFSQLLLPSGHEFFVIQDIGFTIFLGVEDLPYES